MSTYRHHLITQTLALLPAHLSICYAAYAAHRQQDPCPPVWRPFKLYQDPCPPVWRPFKFYQYRRRQQALRWLLDAVVRSLRGHMFVEFYLQSRAIKPDNLLHVRTAYLQDLLNHTTEDSPTLNFEGYLSTQPAKPTDPDLQTLPGCI